MQARHILGLCAALVASAAITNACSDSARHFLSDGGAGGGAGAEQGVIGGAYVGSGSGASPNAPVAPNNAAR